ncbi:MAG: hypothetical protein NTW06_02375, partial [Candidatus Falkowbacteria bacterium]|nr:hypothetical protein [Candidatus Falkowbacteria bacterium]
MLLDLAILIITIGVNLALAILILIKNRKPIANKIFIFFILGILSWIIANYLADHSSSSDRALFWSQISWATAAFSLFWGINFVYYFPYKDKFYLKAKLSIFSFLVLF